jgi:hypothetical protein
VYSPAELLLILLRGRIVFVRLDMGGFFVHVVTYTFNRVFPVFIIFAMLLNILEAD